MSFSSTVKLYRLKGFLKDSNNLNAGFLTHSEKSHSLFLCSSHLNSSTTYQNKAVLISNILMEKTYNLHLSCFLCMAFTLIQFNKSSEERDKKTSTYKHHSLLSPQHFLLIKSAMKKTSRNVSQQK